MVHGPVQWLSIPLCIAPFKGSYGLLKCKSSVEATFLSKPINLKYGILWIPRLNWVQKKLLARDTCIQYIFTFLCPDSQPASADPPPSPHTHSSGASDVDISGLTPTAGNTPNCVCVQVCYFLLSLNMRLSSCSCILSSCLSQKETVRRCRWVKYPSRHLRCSATAQRGPLSSGTVYVF